MKSSTGITDRNGYAPSILGAYDCCFVCYRKGDLARHEVIHGAFRERSKKYGLWVNVCPECHNKIHFTDGKLDRLLKENAQRQAMRVYGWSVDEWRRKFGKNYLSEVR